MWTRLYPVLVKPRSPYTRAECRAISAFSIKTHRHLARVHGSRSDRSWQFFFFLDWTEKTSVCTRSKSPPLYSNHVSECWSLEPYVYSMYKLGLLLSYVGGLDLPFLFIRTLVELALLMCWYHCVDIVRDSGGKKWQLSKKVLLFSYRLPPFVL